MRNRERWLIIHNSSFIMEETSIDVIRRDLFESWERRDIVITAEEAQHEYMYYNIYVRLWNMIGWTEYINERDEIRSYENIWNNYWHENIWNNYWNDIQEQVDSLNNSIRDYHYRQINPLLGYTYYWLKEWECFPTKNISEYIYLYNNNNEDVKH